LKLRAFSAALRDRKFGSSGGRGSRLTLCLKFESAGLRDSRSPVGLFPNKEEHNHSHHSTMAIKELMMLLGWLCGTVNGQSKGAME
jgi:hypothetical protein